jgi:hypothetical protein
MSATAYRTLLDNLTAKDNLIAEVIAGMKELDAGRRQEMVGYVQELLEEYRAEQLAEQV